jgi:hypothetical protein
MRLYTITVLCLYFLCTEWIATNLHPIYDPFVLWLFYLHFSLSLY